MGVLHHANYLTYFEMGRIELLRAGGFSYREMEATGLLMVVVKVEVKYRLPARYDDLLRLCTTVTKVSAAKVEHAYELLRGEELLAQGASTLACVDRSGVVQRIPDWMRGDRQH